MSAHEGHDHPATKAARAACRRGRAQPEGEAATKTPSAKPKPRERAVKIDPALPHDFDPVIGKPTKCYVCGRALRASVHDEAAQGGPGRFVFDAKGKLTGLRLW